MNSMLLIIVGIRSNEHVRSYQRRHNGAAGIAACLNVAALSARTNPSAQQASRKIPASQATFEKVNPDSPKPVGI